MPIPPLLVPPAPREPIASQPWGVPVTDAVNGLVTGEGIIGCFIYTEAGGQTASSTYNPVTILADYVKYDSDGFVDVAGNRFVIPPGLAGVYQVDWNVSTTSYTSGSGLRMSVRKNGTTLFQAQGAAAYNSMFSWGFAGKMVLNDGDVIQAYIQAGTNQPLVFKSASLQRIHNLPVPIAITRPGDGDEDNAPVVEPHQ
jgi:hypothetical protein